MVDRMIAQIFGYLQLSVSGVNRIKFINQCATLGIPQWAVRVRSNSIILCTSITGFKAMRRPARQQRCQVRVLHRRGLPFVAQRLRRRASFSLGAILFVVLLWFLSSFVWFIELEGSEKVNSADINAQMRLQGVYIGAWRSSIEHDKVASALLREFPQLAWAGISIEGSRVLVKLVDKETVQPPQRVPGDVVASKAGVLLRVIATSGQAIAASGQTVSPGQVLIRGEIIIEEQVSTQVMAEGIAEARVWYEALGHSQMSRQVQIPSGVSVTADVLKVGSYEILVTGVRVCPFELYETSLVKRILLPGVEHVTITYTELTLENELVSQEQARLEATGHAESLIKELLPKGVTVADIKTSEEWSPDGNTVTVRVLAEAHEDIGQFMPY